MDRYLTVSVPVSKDILLVRSLVVEGEDRPNIRQIENTSVTVHEPMPPRCKAEGTKLRASPGGQASGNAEKTCPESHISSFVRTGTCSCRLPLVIFQHLARTEDRL